MSEFASSGRPELRLENLQIVARPRQHWEALDLGVLIARRFYPALLASWLCLAAPVFVLVWLVLPEHPLWALFVFWWLKPAYERIPLAILATSIFGVAPTLRGAMRAWRSAVLPAIAQALTIGRLSPARSTEAPVWVLEGLDGVHRKKRLGILRAHAGSGAFWLTIIGVHVEAFLVVGAITGVYLFIPSSLEVDWWDLLTSASQGQQVWLVNLLYLLAMAVVAPVYTGAGFALYLNRRVELEAWDIEIGFRRLAQRASELSRRTSAVMLPAVFVGLLSSGLLVPGAELRAEELPENLIWDGPQPVMEVLSPRRQASRDGIYEVLAGPDFNQQRVISYPKFLQDLFEPEDVDPVSGEDLSWLVEVIGFVARIAEVALWVGVVALVMWLLYTLRLLDLADIKHRRRRRESPREILGLAVSEDSLPGDVAASAMALWNDGEQRSALSLIYRATLTSLINRFDCELTAADTEAECLLKARQVLPRGSVDYLSQLTRAWQFAAYAHALPAEAQFIELCRSWRALFGSGSVSGSVNEG